MSQSLQSRIRCAVVGVGYLGRFHAQKYKALATQSPEQIEFVGVCDASPERSKEIATELGVQSFTDPKDLIGKVDAVTVATSTQAHYDVAKMLLSAGIHVHVEKPMTATVAQGEDLVRIAAEKNVRLQVGHVERFNPALSAAKEKLGRPLFIECHRLAAFKPRGADVDVIMDLMIHDIDVVLSLVKSNVTSVSAVGTPVLTKTIDIANVRLEFESGTVANLTASRVSQNSMRKFRVFQQAQYLSMDFGSGELNLTTKKGEWTDGNVPLEFDSWSMEKADALLEETKAFIHAIQTKTRPIVSGEDGLIAMKVAETIQKEIWDRLSRNGFV